MKPKPMLIGASLIAVLAGCATVEDRPALIKAEAHFTIPHLEASQVDVAPKQTRDVAFNWVQGEDQPDRHAVAQYIIDTQGIPREVQWVEASDAAFAQHVVWYISQLRFRPAKKAGEAVAMKSEMTIGIPGRHFPSFSAMAGRPTVGP